MTVLHEFKYSKMDWIVDYLINSWRKNFFDYLEDKKYDWHVNNM